MAGVNLPTTDLGEGITLPGLVAMEDAEITSTLEGADPETRANIFSTLRGYVIVAQDGARFADPAWMKQQAEQGYAITTSEDIPKDPLITMMGGQAQADKLITIAGLVSDIVQ